MLIRNWMSKEVVTITEDTSILKASKLMQDNNIRRIPVVNSQNQLVGIVSDRDIKAASPSKATTLEMHEVYYLLSELKARDVMTPNPVTVYYQDTVEQVALVMLEKGLTGLPVIDENNSLVGIITEHDLFKVLVDLSGVTQGGIQIAMELPNQPGHIPPVFERIRECGGRIISLMSGSEDIAPTRSIFLRIRPLPQAEEEKLRQVLEKDYTIQYWVKTDVIS